MTTPTTVSRPIRPLRRSEYDAMVNQGFFSGEHIELIDGQLVAAEAEGDRHAATIRRLSRVLFDAIPAAEAEIGIGNPLAVNDLSEPEPDLMVIPLGTYRGSHPRSATLAIEVSYSSRRYDLAIKARLYGSAGIPEYWVVDLVKNRIVVHREPRTDGYAAVTAVDSGTVTSLHHPAVVVDVAALCS